MDETYLSVLNDQLDDLERTIIRDDQRSEEEKDSLLHEMLEFRKLVLPCLSLRIYRKRFNAHLLKLVNQYLVLENALEMEEETFIEPEELLRSLDSLIQSFEAKLESFESLRSNAIHQQLVCEMDHSYVTCFDRMHTYYEEDLSYAYEFSELLKNLINYGVSITSKGPIQ